jgi:hypothetical protein
MTAHRSDIPEDILSEAELLDEPGGKILRLRFEGRFQGRQVTWLATLLALAESQPTDPTRQPAPPITSRSVRPAAMQSRSRWGCTWNASTRRRCARP